MFRRYKKKQVFRRNTSTSENLLNSLYFPEFFGETHDTTHNKSIQESSKSHQPPRKTSGTDFLKIIRSGGSCDISHRKILPY